MFYLILIFFSVVFKTSDEEISVSNVVDLKLILTLVVKVLTKLARIQPIVSSIYTLFSRNFSLFITQPARKFNTHEIKSRNCL